MTPDQWSAVNQTSCESYLTTGELQEQGIGDSASFEPPYFYEPPCDPTACAQDAPNQAFPPSAALFGMCASGLKCSLILMSGKDSLEPAEENLTWSGSSHSECNIIVTDADSAQSYCHPLPTSSALQVTSSPIGPTTNYNTELPTSRPTYLSVDVSYIPSSDQPMLSPYEVHYSPTTPSSHDSTPSDSPTGRRCKLSSSAYVQDNVAYCSLASYLCPDYSKIFPKHSALISHSRKHTGERRTLG